MDRLNTAVVPFGVKPKEISVDFSIAVFALIAAIIEFSIAKIQIKFGYFFYVKSSTPDDTEEEQEEDLVKRTSNRMNKILNSLVYVNFLTPVIIVVMFINPLSKDILVPEYISAGTYTLQKIFVVLMSLIFRAFTFREEC